MHHDLFPSYLVSGKVSEMSSLLTDETYKRVLMGRNHSQTRSILWMHGNNLNSYSLVYWDSCGDSLGGLLPNPESLD